MKKKIKILCTLYTFIMFSFNLNAEEIWYCEGWTSNSKGTKSEPFVLSGNYEKYYIESSGKKTQINKVGENKTSFYDIYVSFDGSIQRPYIIEKDNHSESWRGNGFHNQSKSLKIIELNLKIEQFFTNCIKQ